MKTVTNRRPSRFFVGLLFLTTLMGLSAASHAAALIADFNGDGKNDTATITASSGTISIAHGGGGVSTYYTFSNWLTIHAIETNGIAGKELIATYASGYVHVIDDRAKTARGYNVFGISSTLGSRTYFLTELNGTAGTEILFIYSKGHVAIIDDRLHAVRGYNVFGTGFGGPTRYFKIADFNGVPGNEIMFSYMSGTSEVVDDRRRTIRTYNYLSDGSAPTYANVDGVAGLEAIFRFHGSTIWLVDRTGALIYR